MKSVIFTITLLLCSLGIGLAGKANLPVKKKAYFNDLIITKADYIDVTPQQYLDIIVSRAIETDTEVDPMKKGFKYRPLDPKLTKPLITHQAHDVSLATLLEVLGKKINHSVYITSEGVILLPFDNPIDKNIQIWSTLYKAPAP